MLPIPGSMWWAIALLAAVGVWRGGTWGRRVLQEPARYSAAVAHLPRSAAVRRASGWVAASAMRRRGLGIAAPLVRSAVLRAMATAPFAAGWWVAHRVVHRSRLTRGSRRPFRVAGAMLGMAAAGHLLGRRRQTGIDSTFH